MTYPTSNLRGDRYAIIKLLGEGGQAATFEAVDKKEGKPVAIKRFRVRGAKSWKEVELAEREARVLASLSHPGLPYYIEHFEENGELFLVTEKIEGESLAALQKRGATLADTDLYRFLRDVSSILDYLHGRAPPVVHRDIKPSNVIRRPDGSFVLIDFGAVRDKMKPEGGSTVVGTFGFMAPEQFQGRAMPASDVYAVGATAITMLTGRQPEDLPHKGLGIDVASALGSRANPALVNALAAMLEPDPDRRPNSIAPLLATLRDSPSATKTQPNKKAPRKEPAPQRSSRDIEKNLERGINEAVRQMEQGISQAAEEWSKKSTKYESKTERKSRKAERKAERRARREERSMTAPQPSNGIPQPIAGILLLGLTLAQIAVLVGLRAIVPALLTVLSVFFGKPLKDAAARTHEAGLTAHESMERAKAVIRGHAEPTPLGGPRIEVRSVDPANEASRVRIDADDVNQQAEDEQAAEDEAGEAESKQKRRTRR